MDQYDAIGEAAEKLTALSSKIGLVKDDFEPGNFEQVEAAQDKIDEAIALLRQVHGGR